MPPEYPFLLADLGTNGEFVLALSPDERLVASVPMGPAIEGVGLSCGRTAGPGAVTGFELSPSGLGPVSLPGKAGHPGMTGTAYFSLAALLLNHGVLDESGRFGHGTTPLATRLATRLKDRHGEPSFDCGEGLHLLASDVEELLKVKAAFDLAVSTLLRTAGLRPSGLKAMHLAGALGEHADIGDLERLGFLPAGIGSRVLRAGNTSLSGTQRLLASPEARVWVERLPQGIRPVDLTDNENFTDDFVKRMRFTHVADTLFPPLEPEIAETLEAVGPALREAYPLKGKHFRFLPGNIKDMSRSLTTDRSEARKIYMSEGKFLSAYLYYFLPWNLYRFTRLFGGLAPDLQDGATIADLGSGPLTAPLALWIARPELRYRKLNFICIDKAPASMQAGMDIFKALTKAVAGKCPWRFKLIKGDITKPMREKADLVIAANAFNELNWAGKNADSLGGKIAKTLLGGVKPEGNVLLIETGVRLTGRIISIMRERLMENGLTPLAPCPHSGACPMPGTSHGRWCHFNFDVKDAPQWLEDITRKARLTKKSVSLNFLYLSRDSERREGMARAVSEPFDVEGGKAQYGCSERGLTLLRYKTGALPLFPGQSVKAHWPETDTVDQKSGALELPVTFKKKPEQK
ncbi:ASKHA domain-containing protein [Salidesulfovibrio brasiliensis]|uniref:ASKHA domain-containing protein n=1 Tax=Salidesulfovibrio brasiliensis TaxID=221711 RepID=UPI001FE075ED|nr:ASKHA domain-containing protein [Salidesulfovibrio brasiliensis]